MCSMETTEQGKVFNDPIHGHIELHPLLIKIIDTPQFQRLRNIRQLGGAYFVYPGASHNRFEHSIGVCHLAGLLLEALRARQRDLNITKRDILCVQIAGLCHDLGHGPFSHLFDGMFIPKARKKNQIEGDEWKHEKASLDMFDYMVKCNGLEKEMEEHGLKPAEDMVFIKEMIIGSLDTEGQEESVSPANWPYKGREKEKFFLYEIVSNKTNGIDVDKFDYLARDCYHLGIRNNFDYRRFITFARVCEVDGKKHLCTRDKMVDNMYDLFYTRYCLHRRVCYHRVTNIIQIMIRDAFLKADQYLMFEGTGGEPVTLSTATEHMEVYTRLTDNVFQEILNSSDPNLDEAKEILKRIISRDLYKLLGQKPGAQTEEETEALIPELEDALTQGLPEGLESQDFDVTTVTMDYGMDEEDPFQFIYFYSKEDPTVASRLPREERPKLVTEDFSERLIRFYFKKTDEDENTRESLLATAKEHYARVFPRQD